MFLNLIFDFALKMLYGGRHPATKIFAVFTFSSFSSFLFGAKAWSAPNESAHGPNRARRKSRFPLCGRLRRSLRRLPYRGFDIVRCSETGLSARSSYIYLSPNSGLSARSSYIHRGSAVSHRVVDIVRRHHTVVIVGSGSRALCSYTCVQILIGHHDAWSPLGRQTWARPRVHAARESPCMLSCFACVLF